MRAGLIAMLVAGAPALAATPAAPARLTAQQYRQSLAPVTSCAEFAKRSASLPDARPLLRDLFSTGIPVKGAAENDGAYLDRVVKHLFGTLGDPSRLVLRVSLAGATRYDPARGAVVVRLPHPFEASLDRWGRSEIRIGSGARLVTETELRAGFEFPAGAVPGEIALPMTPEQAQRFADAGRLQILSLFQDYGTDAGHSTATRGGGAAVQTSYKLVRLQPKCAIVTDGAEIVNGWSFDRWTAPEPTG